MRRSRLGEIVGNKSFVLGVCSGTLLVTNWRSVLKAGIKGGLRLGSSVQRAAVRGAENVADLTHEVRSEVSSEALRANSNGSGREQREGVAPSAP